MPNADIIDNTITGKSYAVHQQCANYANSKSTCEGVTDTHLIHVETEDEQFWLYEQLISLSLPTSYWIGLQKVNNEWSWVDSSGSTPLVDPHRISGYNQYGPSYCYAIGQSAWQQLNSANCFPYICEHTTPVTSTQTSIATTTVQTSVETTSTVTSTEPTATTTSVDRSPCTLMRKTTATITNVALLSVASKGNLASCARECFSINDCIASHFDSSTTTCTMYKPGSYSVGCGISGVAICHEKMG
ncbi:uncharacterized protein LOC132557083 [Ylistrum balloti]|uniref:uncharacterized protein LOC132557083 n=1 Tax=Ylistrum balloti TaxID=509963 RepID=UPI002905DCE4|nr:uncharacterized protein LOC132557083 [Ylistrum balloti]